MTVHIKTALDPLTAGTLGVMLPAAILRALGTGGYAGSISAGAGWRRPLMAATDAAVNRAAEGVGDLAMATAGLNFALRKAMGAIPGRRDPELPREDEDEREARESFLEDYDDLAGMDVVAAAFDDEIRKHAGLFNKAVPTLRSVAEPFMKPGANVGVRDVVGAASTVLRHPKLTTEAEGIFRRFQGSPDLQAQFPSLAALAKKYPEPLAIPVRRYPGVAKEVLGDPKIVDEGRALAAHELGFDTVAAAFDDEIRKLGAFKSQAQRRWMHAAEARGEVKPGTAARWERHTPEGQLPERVEKLAEHLAEHLGFDKLEDKLRGKVRDPGAVAATIGRKKYGRKKFQAAAAKGKPLVKKAEPAPPKGWYESGKTAADWDRHLAGESTPKEKVAVAWLEQLPDFMAAGRRNYDMIMKASAVKVGPPPKRNRREYPFIGTIQFQDLPEILVENQKGSIRSGVGPGGKVWKTTMPAHYGEFRRTKGADGDAVDVYVGPSEKSTNVYVVHTRKPPAFKQYDEDKVFVGFDSVAEVSECMLKAYDDKRFLGSISACSLEDLKKVLAKRSARGLQLDQPVVMAKAAGSLWLGFDAEVRSLGLKSGAPRSVLFAARS